MKIRYNPTLTSTIVLSVCLASFIPKSLHWVSNWRELYLQMPSFKEQNYFTPLGFYSLGHEMIGLIVLWTGYCRKERWAWFVMLISTVFFVFPLNGLNFLIRPDWSGLFYGIRIGYSFDVWLGVEMFSFLLMLIALLLPIRHSSKNQPTSPNSPTKQTTSKSPGVRVQLTLCYLDLAF